MSLNEGVKAHLNSGEEVVVRKFLENHGWCAINTGDRTAFIQLPSDKPKRMRALTWFDAVMEELRSTNEAWENVE